MSDANLKKKSKCKKDEIMRKGYITKTGRIVPTSCIIAQSNSGEKTSEKVIEYLKNKEKVHKLARKKFSKEAEKKCLPGYIMREGYKVNSHKSRSKKGSIITVKGHWSKPKCIKSQTGKSSKGPKLIVILEKNDLSKYGYHKVKNLTVDKRRQALSLTIKNNKPLSIYRKINALATLNKNKDLDLYKIFKEDADWIKKQPEYISKLASSKKKSKINSK